MELSEALRSVGERLNEVARHFDEVESANWVSYTDALAEFVSIAKTQEEAIILAALYGGATTAIEVCDPETLLGLLKKAGEPEVGLSPPAIFTGLVVFSLLSGIYNNRR